MTKSALVLGVVAAASLSACGTQDSGVRAASQGDAGAVERRADDLFTQISGTAEQREAAHFLSVTSLNSSFVGCMQAEGYSVNVPTAPLWAGWEPNATSGAWMGELNKAPSNHALATAEAARLEQTGAPRVPGYAAASSRCDSKNLNTDVVIGESPGEPPGYQELTADFKKLIFDIDKRLGPISEYTECMSKQGIDYARGAEGNEGWQGLYLHLEAAMPLAPMAEDKPSKEWETYLGQEVAALRADENCRAERYRQGLSMLGGELEEFQTKHSDEIAAVHAGWLKAVDQATAAGFDFPSQ